MPLKETLVSMAKHWCTEILLVYSKGTGALKSKSSMGGGDWGKEEVREGKRV